MVLSDSIISNIHQVLNMFIELKHYMLTATGQISQINKILNMFILTHYSTIWLNHVNQLITADIHSIDKISHD